MTTDKKIKAKIVVSNGIANYTFKDGSDVSFMCTNIRYAMKTFKTVLPNEYKRAVIENR